MRLSLKCRHLLVRGFAFVLVCYFVVKFIEIAMKPRKALYHHERLERDGLKYVPRRLVNTSSTKLIKCQKVIQLAVVLLEPNSCREFSHLLKTILYHRRHGLRLYLLTTSITRHSLMNLLNTWELQHVDWDFIDLELLKVARHTANSESFLQVALPYLLPQAVQKQVILLSGRMRILDSLEDLWSEFSHFTNDQTYGIVQNSKPSKKQSDSLDVLLLNIDKIREKEDSRLNKVIELHKSNKNVQKILAKFLGPDPYVIPCSWAVGLGQLEDECKSKTQALIWNPHEDHFTGNIAVELAKERTISILSSQTDLYRHQPLDCSHVPHQEINIDPKSKCLEYRHAEIMKRRTHPYYVAPEETYASQKIDEHDVALLTQFTLDRFGTFERFMANWEGPVIAVLYMTDGEALKLPQIIASSGVLKSRKNIAYHIVYQRGKFYPINYLRNVAVKEARTPFLLFVDVDLVVNSGIYPMLKQYIKQYMLNGNNMTLVVPAFEALVPIDDLPKNKTSLLRLMDDKKVIGYRMNRGWNLGHKPTDYPQWVKSNKPYKAKWKDAYEPYMVLATKNAPLYREILLERMGDKIAYGREIYARGYTFLVLPDVFILHLPHPTSAGTNMWKHYPGYGRCGAILFNEYRELLKQQHPDKQF